GSENSKRIILQVQRYIEDHYSDAALSVKEISKAVYLSPNYMSNLFKRETGASLVEYIRDIRIRHSISLLRDDSLKLYHIALKVG
ncbi:helix-turn-helix domain-containing protein, partial [Finegoldia magna]